MKRRDFFKGFFCSLAGLLSIEKLPVKTKSLERPPDMQGIYSYEVVNWSEMDKCGYYSFIIFTDTDGVEKARAMKPCKGIYNGRPVAHFYDTSC